ncbi:outer envelope pore protein 21, chloroplastic-like [Cucurbita moschata]|uniref:Outer envelope pore protein 21, chloroplastic-like n=1 Tax=Cucurbita moschata TaxID=3662 RepID=A0A6J1G3I0_CUCMO|nr:outer envelope pore protein 21, chloroplastic-like [Cucurbita moschata]
MDTSLRYAGDSRALGIHAKEKIPLNSNTFLEVRGELDTRIGEPSLLAASVRKFYPDLFSSVSFGVKYDKYKKLHYLARGKVSLPVANDGLLKFTIKGQSQLENNFKQHKGAAEFSLGVLNFLREQDSSGALDFERVQDIRVKVGYEVFEKTPYIQIRENNWTLNADLKGRWNVRFDL